MYWKEYNDTLGTWVNPSANLLVEYKQCLNEGLDVAAYEKTVREVNALPDNEQKKILAEALYKALEISPMRENYPYDEPSTLDEIRAKRPDFSRENKKYRELRLTEAELYDKILGGWYGRTCGCLLGKPVEGIRSYDIEAYCRRIDNWPLTKYIMRDEEKIGNLAHRRCFINQIDGAAPSDDDTNYTVMALKLLETKGFSFTPSDMAFEWLRNMPIFPYCTAERAAYRNFIAGIKPPESATYLNPYREYIGAQIRGDLFGWVTPGNTELAAELAFRDASISHIKNGIYGEMYIAAVLAASFHAADVREALTAGLGEIPEKSRLNEDINIIFKLYDADKTYEDFLKFLHESFDEHNGYDWCYTNSNTMIVAASLLWGENDYTKTVCNAIIPGFDTDCNGATAGSIFGILHGIDAIGNDWKSPIQTDGKGKLITDIKGYENVTLEDMAKRTTVLAMKSYEL